MKKKLQIMRLGMSKQAFQKVFRNITNITKATCTVQAEGVSNEEMALVDGNPAQFF